MTIPKTFLTASAIAQMIDISAVRADSSDESICAVVERAKHHHCYLVTTLPSQTRLARSLIEIGDGLKLGGNVGFPSGGQTTSIKVNEARELIEMGVDEIDMVIDIGAHISGRHEDVYQDILEVVQAAEDKPVKVILECYYLNDEQIRVGCDLALKAGAGFIKTGTGWTPTGATLENVALIKQHVGDAIKIKASGGIRGLEIFMELYRRGASRFGISVQHAANIITAAERLGQPIAFR